MEGLPPTDSQNVPVAQRKRHLRTMAWAIPVITASVLVLDFSHFLTQYYDFHSRALAGIEQISVPRTDSETIVVLTGDIGRIPRAIELLRVRGARKLLISGAARGVGLAELVNQQGASTEQLPKIWSKIELESDSSSTVENAYFTRQRLVTSGLPDRFILVTSDYHMGRSLAVFRRMIPECEILPYSVPSLFSGKDSFHFVLKTGIEYWKSLIYRFSLLIGLEPSKGQ
jgi:uncharacterized SAM-binding protein YcdF (DUF218 family)